MLPSPPRVDSALKLKPESIWLTCDFNGDGNTSVKKYPRATGAATAGDLDPATGVDYGGADYVYNREIQIQSVDTGAGTITVNVSGSDYGQGAITDTTTHAFVADATANAGAVRVVNHYVSGGSATPTTPSYFLFLRLLTK